MAAKFPIKGAVVALTGAAGGIGAALALDLARRGADLALADRNAEGLAATAAAAASGPRVSLHPMDVADPQTAARWPAEVAEAHGRPASVLINNAGIALAGDFAEVAEADFDRLMAVNLHAPIRLTRAFLPDMLTLPAAQIVNVSSLFGLIAPPGQTAYAAAKFGLRGFSESLRHELAGGPVGVTLVHPGGVRTAIARSAKLPPGADAEALDRRRRTFEKNLRMAPERAAALIAEGLAHRTPRLVIGSDAKLLSSLQRLFPTAYWRLIAPLMAGGAE